MAARISFLLIGLFWLVMNGLLLRSEFGPRDAGADAVPTQLVWRRILTAPNPSSLTIWQGEQRLGFGHWISGVGEELAELDEDATPEGDGRKVRTYNLRLDGSLTWPGQGFRLRFEGNVKLSTNQTWQEFSLRLAAHQVVWELHSVAAEQTVRFHSEEDGRQFNRVFRFSELQNPQALVAEFAGPAGLGFLGALGLPLGGTGEPALSAGLRWEASSVVLAIGREPVRVFRLQTRLLDRFPLRIFVSRAGEILRVELPNGILLKHDQINLRLGNTRD